MHVKAIYILMSIRRLMNVKFNIVVMVAIETYLTSNV